ncbi:hypothetical protein X777_02342 [Ooceraea biroi]|uniref:Uncharacterized protein n=1 Tax=Ooceraea biroi TaxID=2015173 RepID=A0A026WL03_OOCBI|nr:hypothetical protein X777_02342 [Ooceraea biroi]
MQRYLNGEREGGRSSIEKEGAGDPHEDGSRLETENIFGSCDSVWTCPRNLAVCTVLARTVNPDIPNFVETTGFGGLYARCVMCAARIRALPQRFNDD